MKKRIVFAFSCLLLFLISFNYVTCTNKCLLLSSEKKEIELEENIVVDNIQYGCIYIDIGSENYGLDCHFYAHYESSLEEMIIKSISFEIPEKQIKINKEVNFYCNVKENKYNSIYWDDTKNEILIDDILNCYNIKFKSALTKTYLYWRLHKSKNATVTYEIEYRINGKLYTKKIKQDYIIKPSISSRVLDTMMSV